MDFELLVIGLMLYGVVFLAFAAFRQPREAPAAEWPDRHDAPIVVRRGADRRASTVAVRKRTRRAV